MLVTSIPSSRDSRDGSPFGLARVTWVRLDDGFPDHPKVLSVGPRGCVIQIRAICYCSRFLTDGLISRAAYMLITADLAMEGGPDAMAESMVKAGLWERVVPDGWRVHDYLEYNPSRTQVEEARRLRSEAGKRGGMASGESRANRALEANRSRSVQPKANHIPSQRDGKSALRSTKRKVKSRKPGSFGRL